MSNKFYIAYGSNLNLEQMANRCPTARVVGAGNRTEPPIFLSGTGTDYAVNR